MKFKIQQHEVTKKTAGFSLESESELVGGCGKIKAASGLQANHLHLRTSSTLLPVFSISVPTFVHIHILAPRATFKLVLPGPALFTSLCNTSLHEPHTKTGAPGPSFTHIHCVIPASMSHIQTGAPRPSFLVQ